MNEIIIQVIVLVWARNWLYTFRKEIMANIQELQQVIADLKASQVELKQAIADEKGQIATSIESLEATVTEQTQLIEQLSSSDTIPADALAELIQLTAEVKQATSDIKAFVEPVEPVVIEPVVEPIPSEV